MGHRELQLQLYVSGDESLGDRAFGCVCSFEDAGRLQFAHHTTAAISMKIAQAVTLAGFDSGTLKSNSKQNVTKG